MTNSIFRLFCPAVLLSILTAVPGAAQQVDSSFGTNGIASTNFSGMNPAGTNDDAAVKAFNLPGGKILVVSNHVHSAGPTIPRVYTMRLVRYTNAGVTDGPPGNNSGTIAARERFIAYDAAMQPDGKIVVAGYTSDTGEFGGLGDLWAIARYNADGTPDTTPSGQEWFVARRFTNNIGIINDVEIQPDGKIVVLGNLWSSANIRSTVVARYNTDAQPDLSFGPYGEGFFDLYDNSTLSRKLIIQPNGKLLLGGNFYVAYLASYNTDGTQDTTFGDGGYVRLDYSTTVNLSDLKLQPDGKILALLDIGYGHSSVLARLNPNGSKDLSFTPNGAVFFDNSAPVQGSNGNVLYLTGGVDIARSIIQRSNGNIVVGGFSIQLIFSASPRREIFSAIEYDSSGQLLNKSFSRHSLENQVLTRPNYFDAAGAIEQPDGKILFYGKINESSSGTFAPPYNVALARYSSISARKDANFYFDYDFDDKSEFAVFRPSNNGGFGNWYFLSNGEFIMRQYGAPGDILAPGDYDGGGTADMGVFRPSTGEWITKSVYLNNCQPMTCNATTIQFGANGDIPAPGDFDGDGRTDRAVFRPSGGDWYILLSSGGVRGLHFGQNGDQPVTGDYDGDGKSDAAVIRRENGQMFWYILQSSDGAFVGLQFGLSEDKAVVADYNADAKTDIAVWRPSNGTWYVLANYTDFSAA
ncbi:MAG TPA: hypothetical protein VF721_11185, partial [Pyrinomonadaceae bacterium]